METDQLLAQFDELAKNTPKDPSCYVFIGEADGRFVGNVKYLFLYFARQLPDIKSCFLTSRRDVYRMLREADLPAVLFPEIEAIKTLACAGTIVVDTFDTSLLQLVPCLNTLSPSDLFCQTLCYQYYDFSLLPPNLHIVAQIYSVSA